MMTPRAASLKHTLTTVEYFTFGFGAMVGVGWVVLMDDWLGRGGPAGAALGFLLGGVLLLPVGLTYGRLVREIPDAGAEIAYTEGVLPPFVGFGAGWIMVLAYAIVCPWEAVAVGNLLARVLPGLNTHPLYAVRGQLIYAPRLALGLLLTAAIALLNDRGIRSSAAFQRVTTFTFLTLVSLFALLGLTQGSPPNLLPLFARPGIAGAGLSTLLVLQVVPYFMTGFESVAKGSEEAREGFDPRGFGRAILLAVVLGAAFYVTVVGVVSYVFPWLRLVGEHLGTEAAFERAFSSRAIARVILVAALLSLLKIFNANFVAATRLVFAIGRRGLIHSALGRIDPVFGTPRGAILLLAVLTAIASCLGDAVLVPTTEVGSLAVGVGWLSACASYLLRFSSGAGRAAAVVGALVSMGIVLMKVVPAVPGSFTSSEWIAFGLWCGLGLVFWLSRR